MLCVDLRGKRALVAGVADDSGLGFAIAKSLARAGATLCVAAWPPALGVLQTMLRVGKLEPALAFEDGSGKLSFERIYALDAEFDELADIPAELRENRRYRDLGDVSIAGLARQLECDFGSSCLDIVVHSLANGPEVRRPLLETTRGGYLSALGASAYSQVSFVQRLGPLMRRGGSFLSLSYIASERVIPGYGGGMSSAKAALESDTRTLAYEAGRTWGHRVNAISAGPYASRAAKGVGMIDQMIDFCKGVTPLPEPVSAREVGDMAAVLSSPLASAVTGATVYVDKGFHAMGVLDPKSRA